MKHDENDIVNTIESSAIDALFNQNRDNKYISQLESNYRKLLELVAHMKKDGYTYDQLNRKINICDKCFKEIQ